MSLSLRKTRGLKALSMITQVVGLLDGEVEFRGV